MPSPPRPRAPFVLAAALLLGVVVLPGLAGEAESQFVCTCPCTHYCFPTGPAAPAPRAPYDLSATSGPGRGEITLAWKDGGGQGEWYAIYRSATGSDSVAYVGAVGASQLRFTDAGLPDGALRHYKVKKTGSAGESGFSNAASATTFDRPGAPSGFDARGGPSLGQVTLAWEAADPRGAAVTAHRVYAGPPGGPLALVATLGDARSYVDSGLADGEARAYQVSAVNLVGEGARTPEAAAAAPLRLPPQAVRALVASSGPGAGEVSLRWDEPAGGTGLSVAYRVLGGDPGGMLAPLGETTARTFTDGGLADGQARSYLVVPFNEMGDGPPSPEVSAAAPLLPGAPRGVWAESWPTYAWPASFGGVRLGWSPPGDGSASVAGYRVYRGTSPAALAFLAATAETAFADTTTSPGRVYYYQVRAVNAAGEGAPSALACAPPWPWIWGFQPAVSAPCPAPAGWEEATLLEAGAPLPGASAEARVAHRWDPSKPVAGYDLVWWWVHGPRAVVVAEARASGPGVAVEQAATLPYAGQALRP